LIQETAGNELPEEEEIKLLVLRVTDDCNLRCRYCYACGGDSRESMSWDIARQAVDYALARSRFLKIQFTGGEPLLNFPLVKKVIEYSRKSPVTFQMQTNGTLVGPAVARELKALKIAPGVSLDGPPEVNDRLRPFAGGQPSTLAIINGLQNLGTAGVKVGLTAVLTKESAAYLTRLVELAAYLGNIHGIALDLLRPMGRCLSGKILPPAPELLAQQVKPALCRAAELAEMGGPLVRFREVERLKYQLRREVVRQHYCYATTGQSLAVMPDGSVYPCSSLAGAPAFYLGHIACREFSLTRSLRGTPLWQRMLNGVEGCRSCPDNWLCGGGCPARAYAYSGRVDRAFTGDCRLKKVFLEYLRGTVKGKTAAG
jgi:uncharacterized protein